MSAEEQLIKLGIELPPAPKPIGLYKPIVVVGNVAYLSGHGPLKSDGTLIIGRVGADMNVEQGQAAARQTGLAMLATLRFALGTLDRVTRVATSAVEGRTVDAAGTRRTSSKVRASRICMGTSGSGTLGKALLHGTPGMPRAERHGAGILPGQPARIGAKQGAREHMTFTEGQCIHAGSRP